MAFSPAWLDEYNQLLPRLRATEGVARARLEAALNEAGISVHTVSSRVKATESVRGKISRPDKIYHALSDVTDLLGFRVITYFEDSIEAVARAVEASFAVDYRDSVDRLRFQDHSRFGYRSLHYVCRLNAEGGGTISGEGGGLRFEIQIRTLLQHAWAEVEHDLGYKRGSAVPGEIRRRFARVASLLEIADQEFVAIRADQERYLESAVEHAWDAQRSPTIDSITLPLLAQTAESLALDEKIAAKLGKRAGTELFFPDYLARMLQRAGLSRLAQAREALIREQGNVLAMVEPYFEFADSAWGLTARGLSEVPRGYGLFFLAHVAVLQSKLLTLDKVGRLTQFYRELDYPDDERTAQQVATSLFEHLRRAGHTAVS
jgi:putative GTP pyrophosphokinase